MTSEAPTAALGTGREALARTNCQNCVFTKLDGKVRNAPFFLFLPAGFGRKGSSCGLSWNRRASRIRPEIQMKNKLFEHHLLKLFFRYVEMSLSNDIIMEELENTLKLLAVFDCWLTVKVRQKVKLKKPWLRKFTSFYRSTNRELSIKRNQNLAENHGENMEFSCYNMPPISVRAEIVEAAVLDPPAPEHKLDIKQLNTFKDQKGERRGLGHCAFHPFVSYEFHEVL